MLTACHKRAHGGRYGTEIHENMEKYLGMG